MSWRTLKIMLLGFSFYPILGYCESAAEEVQARLNAIRSMSAGFSQVVKAGKRELSKTDGNMAFLRPGRFRWQTQSPLAQLIIADSTNLWIYDVDLEQVTVKKQDKGISGTPALFLSNYNQTVTKDFKVTKKSAGLEQSFDLYAKSPRESYQHLILTFKANNLNQIEFFDQLGQHTIVKLTQIKTNIELKSQLFKFQPPKGVDLIRQ